MASNFSSVQEAAVVSQQSQVPLYPGPRRLLSTELEQPTLGACSESSQVDDIKQHVDASYSTLQNTFLISE